MQSQWDLSGPLTDQTVGDAVSAFFIESLVSQLGISSILETEANEAISGLVQDPLSDLIDENAPESLSPDGEVTQALSTVLAEIEVDSELSLEESDGILVGTDTITMISYDSMSIPLSLLAINESNAITISSVVTIDFIDENLNIQDHELEIGYDRLISWALEEVIDVDEEELSESISSVIECDDLLLFFDGNFDLNTLSNDWSVEPEMITDACETFQNDATMRTLGFLRPDTSIVIGGLATSSDMDEDGQSDTIQNADDYGGTTSALPTVFQPRIDIEFSANRN